jgi:hypothetical protein
MQKLLLVALTVILVGAGCSASTVPTEVPFENQTDIDVAFEKKQECSKYLPPYLERWNNQNDSSESYFRPVICYDKKRDTCVVIEQRMDHKSNIKSLDITDLLTNENIYYTFMPSGDPRAQVENTDLLIWEHVNCVE